MKVLFITHTTDTIYGAPKSLQQILLNIECEYDFIYPYFPKKPTPTAEMKGYVGKNCRNIYCCFLPYRNDSIFDKEGTINSRLYYGFLRVVEPIIRWKIKRLIKREHYDYVFLNSTVLYPLLSEKYKAVIFVREWLLGKSKGRVRANQFLQKAHKIVLIDETIKQYLNIEKKDFKVIANPVNMEKVNDVNLDCVEKEYGINTTNKIVVSMIGQIYEKKGCGFIVEAFLKVKRDDMILLMVGNNNESYARDYMSKSKDNSNIIWLGEIREIEKVYKISDYIIRGEEKFGIGRTVYEGLYSGCGVIMPGYREKNLWMIAENERFSDNIHFYIPRSEGDLLEELNKLNKPKKLPAYSNAQDYVDKLMAFVEDDKN